jgi:hypothetical protein
MVTTIFFAVCAKIEGPKVPDVDDGKNNEIYERNELIDLFKTMRLEEPSLKADRVAKFMTAFYYAIQLESDGDDELLSDDEIRILHSILTFSQVTSVRENASDNDSGSELQGIDWNLRRRNRRIAKSLLTKFNKLRSGPLAKMIKEFSVYQQNGKNYAIVWANAHSASKTPLLGYELGLKFDHLKFEFYLKGVDPASHQTVGDILAKNIGPESQFLVNEYDADNDWLVIFKGNITDEKDVDEAKQAELFKKIPETILPALVALREQQ